jgi:putative transposase
LGRNAQPSAGSIVDAQ